MGKDLKELAKNIIQSVKELVGELEEVYGLKMLPEKLREIDELMAKVMTGCPEIEIELVHICIVRVIQDVARVAARKIPIYSREEVKKTVWGGGYYARGHETGGNYCVDCHGWKGSVPDYFWIKDPTSTKTVKCDHCGKISDGVRQESAHEASG
jgi:hypothetical protein